MSCHKQLYLYGERISVRWRRIKSARPKKNIVSAAWRLFYEQGYDDTTVDEIIRASGTSKGTFYHYFKGKDALLTSLSELFDNKYEELIQEMPEEMGTLRSCSI